MYRDETKSVKVNSDLLEIIKKNVKEKASSERRKTCNVCILAHAVLQLQY